MSQESKAPREIILITKTEGKGENKWERISKTLSIAAIPVVLAVVGWVIQGRLQDQTVSRDYVQLAVSILKETDTTKINPKLRDWAVDLLNENSPTKFSSEVARQLKSGETTLPVNITALLNATSNGGSVATSPDGKKFIIGDVDGSAKLWDIESGKLLMSLRGHTGAVTSVTFLPDGKTILTGSEDRTVKIWDLPTGMMKQTLIQTDVVIGIAVTPDGKMLLIRTLDNTITIWEISSGKLISKFELGSSK